MNYHEKNLILIFFNFQTFLLLIIPPALKVEISSPCDGSLMFEANCTLERHSQYLVGYVTQFHKMIGPSTPGTIENICNLNKINFEIQKQ